MLKILTIALATAALGGTIVAGTQLAHSHNGRTEKESDSSVIADGATNLRIKTPIASLTLETGNTQTLSVPAVRWTKNPGSEAGRKWMNSVLSVSRDGGNLLVKDELEGKRSIENINGNFNGGLDLHVVVPRGLQVKLELGLGSADASGQYRSVDLSIGAGHLKGNFAFTGSSHSDLHVGAGQVELTIPRGSNLDVETSTGVGHISGLPEGAKQSGSMHIGDHRSARIGSGGSTLAVHVGAGSIVVNADSVKTLTLSDSKDVHELWSGDAESPLTMKQDLKDLKDLDNLGPMIEQAMAQAQPDIDRAMKMSQVEVEKAMAQVGPEMDRALKAIQPELDRALVNVGPEVEMALKQAKPEMDRELANLGPEIERAMKDAKIEIEKSKIERQRAFKEAGPEIDRAMREAEAALDKASRELDKGSLSQGGLEKSLRKTVADAIRAARQAIRESMKAAKKAAEEAKQAKDPESDLN